jgi:anti-sigma-K factor RskA
MVAWNVQLSTTEGPTAIPAAQVQAPPQLGVSATLADVDGRRVAVMRVRGLGALPTQEGYEVWTIPASGVPVSAGFMTAGGDEFLATVDVSGGETIAITRERRSNTTAPTAQPLVAITT